MNHLNEMVQLWIMYCHAVNGTILHKPYPMLTSKSSNYKYRLKLSRNVLSIEVVNFLVPLLATGLGNIETSSSIYIIIDLLLVREQRGLTLYCCIRFFLLLILVAKGLYVQKLLDDMLSPLSNLRNSRWRPTWPPLHINDHNSLPVHHRKDIFVSIPRF